MINMPEGAELRVAAKAGVSANVRDGPDDQPRWQTVLWMLHWALRIWLAGMLLVYGWSKVFLMQMGLADYGDALTAFGEMSPMGLLWRFMAFSPVVQFLAGVAEVVAAGLLLFRRTAWLGGLLAAADMAVVFLLNMTFDVPVKQTSLMMLIAGLIVAAPWFGRVVRMLAGGPTGQLRSPQAIPWPKVARVTKWLGAAFGVAVLIGSGVAMGGGFISAGGVPSVNSNLPGVYQVVQDAAEPAPQLAEDERWQQVAFGQHVLGPEGQGRFGLRLANGDFRDGLYAVEGDQVTVELYPIREGDVALPKEVESTITLTAQPTDGGVALQGEGVDLVIEPDPEFRYLFDREFRWAPSRPINR